MARFATGLALALAVGLVGASSAQAATYKGVIQQHPESTLIVTVKAIEGDRYVTRIAFKKIPLQCEGGDTVTGGDASAGKPDEPGIEIKGGEFKGPWDYGKVSGKVRAGGKIAGTISLKTDAGGSLGQCSSGKLDYLVKD